jgi:dihydrofolate reductase
MGKLTYSMICSLDGYVADAAGLFDWAVPDEEVHQFINDVTQPVGTYLYGRRMYEMMVYWESDDAILDEPAVIVEWAHQWRAADKVVYSTTLEHVSSERTQLVRDFDPAAARALKADASGDLSIDGPAIAASALRAGLVDEISQYLCPVIVGGGTAFLPADVRLDLELLEQRRFASGVVYVRYGVRT